MKIAKKIVAICLVLIMVVACMPLTVYADNKDEVIRYSVLVLDVSDEVRFTEWYQTIYVANSAIDYIKDSAISFLNSLLNADGKNYVSVVTYDDEEHIVSDFTDDINSISDKVQSLTHGEGSNNMNSGLKAAKSLLEKVNNENAIKNVILVTTGVTGYGDYKDVGHYDDTVIESYWNVNGINLYKFANSAYETAEQLKKISTVYTLGLFQTMEGLADQGKNIAQFFKMVTRDIATSSDTFFEIDDPNNIGFYFGEVKENIMNPKSEDEYIEEHIDFINEKAEYLKSFGNSEIFKETELIATTNSDVIIYSILNSIKDFIDGKLDFESLSDNQLIAQTLVTELLYSEEFNDYLTEAAEKEKNETDEKILNIIYKFRNMFEFSDDDLAKLNKLVNEENKNNVSYINQRNEFLENLEIGSDVSISTVLDIFKESDILANIRDKNLSTPNKEGMLSDVSDIAGKISLALDIGNVAISSIKDIIKFYENSACYKTLTNSFRDALDILAINMLTRVYTTYIPNVPISEMMFNFVVEFVNYVNEIKSETFNEFLSYAKNKASDFLISSKNIVAAELVNTAVYAVAKKLGTKVLILVKGLNLAFHVGMDIWEEQTIIDELEFERKLLLYYSVAYGAVADAFGNGKGDTTYSNLVLDNKDMYSVNVFECGLNLYKKISTLYKNHALKFYNYIYANSTPYMLFLKDKLIDKDRLEEIKQVSDDYFKGINRIPYELPQEIKNKLQRLPIIQGNVLLTEWLMELYIKESFFVNEELIKSDFLTLTSIHCHKTDYVAPKTVNNMKFYCIACPVDITVSNESGIIVQTIQNTIKKSIDDPNMNISIIKNEDGTDYTKILTVPYDYDVAILGYADGNMKIEKMVMKDGIITDTAQFENIPVSNDVHYREVIENNKLVAIEGLDKFDQVVYTTNITDNSNDDSSVEPIEPSMESSIEPSVESSAETSIQTTGIDVPKTGNDNPSILLIVLLIISSGLFCCVIKKSKSDTNY